MPWKEELPMDQKTQFVSEYLRDSLSFTELCQRYHISRKTGYKWIIRYQAEVLQDWLIALAARIRSPDQTPDALRRAIIEPGGGIPPGAQRNCSSFFERKEPQTGWPSRWTVCEILKREGLVRQKTQRRKTGHPGKPTSIITAPNELWCVDFKGQFKTRDGRYCYPLTVTDRYSRYLIGCQGLLSTETLGAKEVFNICLRSMVCLRRSAQTTGRRSPRPR